MTSTYYRISSKGGVDYGLWAGETANDAFRAMLADTGGDTYSDEDAAVLVGSAKDWHITPVRHVTIRVDASRYEDSDDCLSDAARDACEQYGLIPDGLGARWADDERDEILLDIPAETAARHRLS